MLRRLYLNLVCAATVLTGLAAERAPAQDNYYEKPPQIIGMDVEEKIGQTLPMDLAFKDDTGRTVTLGDYFGKDQKPAVILLVYYDCPMVCDLLMTRQSEAFARMDYTVGKDFRALVFSFDDSETPERAAQARKAYLASYKRGDEPGVAEGWKFHVGNASDSRRLADALGFQYRRLNDGNYSHPVCQFIITPDGKVSRYLYGYPDNPRDLNLALMEASQGKLVKSIGERLLAFCYVFDENVGKYTLRAMRIMQLGGAATLLTLGTAIGVMLVAERVRKRSRALRTITPRDAALATDGSSHGA